MSKPRFSSITRRIRGISLVVVCVLLIATLAGASTRRAQAAPTAEAVSGSAPAAPPSPASPASPAAAIGTSFTYQGRLTQSNSPANGQFDLRFTLFDALTGGNQVGSPVSLVNQTVTDGLFTVVLDFGASAFTGDTRYLQLEVRQTGGSTYTLLAPRQSITPAPYALSLRPGTSISGAVGPSILNLTNTSSQGTGVSGVADNGSFARGVYGESTNGEGGFFQSTTGDGLFASGADGIDATGTASDGAGVRGTANGGTTARGLLGISAGGSGVYGTSSTGYGGNFVSTSGTGLNVSGGNGTYSIATASNGAGVQGVANAGTSAKGVYGTSSTGYGIYGASTASNGKGVYGVANTGTSADGVYGTSSAGNGVYGVSTASNGKGVYGVANTGSTASGVYGASSSGYGVYASGGTGVYATGGNGIYSTGTASNGVGVWGVANNGASAKGVYGTSSTGTGVYGTSTVINGYGVEGIVTASGINAAGVYGSAGSSGNFGVEGVADNGTAIYGSSANIWAGYFSGNVHVSGSCCGAGEFYTSIDDPLDPENKYLDQSLVQSPEMLSMIDGNATLDADGESVVAIPTWFEAANKDFRYTLTSVGAPGPNLYIAQKVANGSFKIAGGAPGSEVSWQLTGIRSDPYAIAHPIQPETNKPSDQQGQYLYPSLYGQPNTKIILDWTAQSKP